MESMQYTCNEKELHSIRNVFAVEQNNIIDKILFTKKLNSTLK